MDKLKAKKLIERSIQIVDGKETLVIDVAEDCPFCLEDLYGKFASAKIYENYFMYSVCSKHWEQKVESDQTDSDVN